MRRADTIQIDSDDQGFELVIGTDDGVFRFNIHAVALELEAIVRKELRPYALEAEHARTEYINVHSRGDLPNEPWPFDPDLVRDIGRNK